MTSGPMMALFTPRSYRNHCHASASFPNTDRPEATGIYGVPTVAGAGTRNLPVTPLIVRAASTYKSEAEDQVESAV